MDSTRTPAIGTPVSTPDGPGIMHGVTGHLYAVEYPRDIPSLGIAAGSVIGYAPADVTPAMCEHWECALMGDTCAETATPAPVCHVAGCEATPTHTDPATSAAGLAPYVCRAHYVPGVHVFAAPRVYDALLTAYEYTLLIASGDLTRENALTAALTRDALLTDAERAERHAVSRDRYATRYHGTDWHTLTGRPA